MTRSSFFNSFNSEFQKHLSSKNDQQQAFDAASQKFQESVGNSPYTSLDSFKSVRSRRRKK